MYAFSGNYIIKPRIHCKSMYGAAFFVTCILLGAGIAADAFLAALSNGLNSPRLTCGRVLGEATIFAAFHALAAGIGTACVRIAVGRIDAIDEYLGAIAAAVFVALGVKAVYDGLYDRSTERAARSMPALLIQSAATSVDALSVGFVTAEFGAGMIAVSLVVIAVITFVGYAVGVVIGKRFGASCGSRATILGGAIFIIMGISMLV